MLLIPAPLRLFLAGAAVFALSADLASADISPLAKKPNWKNLDRYQETMSHDEFVELLQNVYAAKGTEELIKVGDKSAQIVTDAETKETLTLRFAAEHPRKMPPVYWREIDQLRRATPKRPLKNLRVALDPGHLGGRWAKMEERWFAVGDAKPVEEGEMTLRVAKLLAAKLRALGAEVSFVRAKTTPTTPLRPPAFHELAKKILAKTGVTEPAETYHDASDEQKEKSIQWQSELLFYRQSEIRYRARRVNEVLQPDLVLCLHFNAEAWGDPTSPTLTDKNHFHVLINGSYAPDEIAHDDERYEMVRRILSRTYAEELPLADTMAASFAHATGLPPYEYTTDTVKKVGTSNYVFARNLLATRVFRCPVIYFEPYVMNSHEVFDRVQAGEYKGTRDFNGVARPNIFREYADAVAKGLVEYCRAHRRGAAPAK